MSRTTIVLAVCLLAALPASADLASRVIRYNGPGSGLDYAADVAVGPDGSIYVAGASTGEGTGLDFTVLCFSPEESLRWVYRWNRSGSSRDVARAIAVGPDGNVYAAGFTVNPVPYYDVAVLSLTPEGDLRWARVHAGEGGGEDSASAIAVDADNNVYAAGVGDDLFGENTEFTVLSFEPDTGGLRWVYYASASYVDEATDVAVADDSTVLASGVLWSGSSRSSYVVAAVNSGDGSERWRNSIARGDDDSRAEGIACRNGKAYAAGWTGYNFTEFTVTAHDVDTGGRDWAWYYSGSNANGHDRAFDVAVGPDGMLYACGLTVDSVPSEHFTVASLTPGGTRRWLYTDTTGPFQRVERACELAVGEDGRVYAAGWRDPYFNQFGDEAVVQCLDSAGNLQWVYRFDNIRNQVDMVEDIALGSNGRVYAVGWSYENGSGMDMLILCLDAMPPAVAEPGTRDARRSTLNASIVRGVLMGRQLTADGSRQELVDAAGRRVLDLLPGPNDVSALAPGVYFVYSTIDNRHSEISKVLIAR